VQSQNVRTEQTHGREPTALVPAAATEFARKSFECRSLGHWDPVAFLPVVAFGFMP